MDSGTDIIDEWVNATEDPKAFTRAWCYVFWDVAFVEKVQSLKPLVHVVGEEICPKTGKLHYQGYMRFKEKVRMSFWYNQFPGQWVRARRRSEAAAAQYCRKDCKILHDYGAPVVEDALMAVLEMIEQGYDAPDIYRAYPKLYANRRKMVYEMRMDWAHWKKGGRGMFAGNDKDGDPMYR